MRAVLTQRDRRVPSWSATRAGAWASAATSRAGSAKQAVGTESGSFVQPATDAAASAASAHVRTSVA